MNNNTIKTSGVSFHDTRGEMSVPVAIILAGVIIAAAIFLTRSQPIPVPSPAENNTGNAQAENSIDIEPVSKTDRILGNPNAELIIVEYSDTECPFCKVFHNTMKALMDEFGKEGKLAWVYRQFPIPSLHSKAPKESEALECAAELGGNNAFWEYLNRLFEITPSSDGLNTAELPRIAEYVGLDVAEFQNCLDSGKYAEKINQDYEKAVSAGIGGTPFSILISQSGEKIVINGAEPIAMIRAKIESLLNKSD